MAEFNMDQFEQDYRNERRKALRDSVESGETSLPVGILQHGANRIGEGVSDTVQGIGAFAKSLYNNPQAVAEAGAEGLEALYNRVAQGDPMAAMEVAGMITSGGTGAALLRGGRMDPSALGSGGGNIIRGFHSTRKDFDELDPERGLPTGNFGQATYFSESNDYPSRLNPNSRIIESNLDTTDFLQAGLRTPIAKERVLGTLSVLNSLEDAMGKPFKVQYDADTNTARVEYSRRKRSGEEGPVTETKTFDFNNSSDLFRQIKSVTWGLRSESMSTDRTNLSDFMRAAGFTGVKGGSDDDFHIGVFDKKAIKSDKPEVVTPKTIFDNPNVQHVSTAEIADKVAQFNLPRYDVGKFGGRFESGNMGENPIKQLAFDKSGRQTLKENISDEGIKEPIEIEVNLSNGDLSIGEGHHRLQAAIELGLSEIPVVIKTVTGPRLKAFEAVGPAKVDTSGLSAGKEYSFSEFNLKERFLTPKQTAQDLREKGQSFFENSKTGEISDRRFPESYTPMREGYYKKFAQGGEVMQGIGTLNETARNMTRGPRGIGAYQQFAIGGPVRGDQFNSQGLGEPLNMPYGPGQMSPYQQPQFGMGGMQQGNGINQYGQYLEQTYGDPEFDQKRDTFLQDVQQQEQQTFGGMDGEQHFGKAMVANPPQDYGFLGGMNPLELYKREQEQRESMKVAQIAQYEDMGSLANTGPALSLFASGGEAMGPPPTRGPDPQGIGYFQKFADGGPVYMQEGGSPSAEEIKSEILATVYEAESNSNFDQWHLNAKNVPEKPLTEMTVEEIMRYQGNNKGPAAGAGQIKFDTLQYLIDFGTLNPTDVFSAETQNKAHSRLLDRRGFQSWVSGEMSNTDFGQNVAKEYAGVPLLADEEVNGVIRPRGSSRYGGSNVARINVDDWEGVLATAKTATPEYGTVAAVDSDTTSPFIETLSMRGEDVAMSMPVEQSDRVSEMGQENLADGRYFQGTNPEDVMTPSVGELLSSKYSRPRTQEAAEAKQRAMARSKETSLYEQFAPEGVQDLFSGIGSYIRGEEPQQEEVVNVYGSPPAKPPETFRKFLRPNSTIL